MGHNMSTDELVLTVIEDGGVRRAQLYVCGNAMDAGDAELLLDALGLNGRVIRSAPRQRYPVKRCSKCHRTRQVKARGMCAGCVTSERRASA